MSINIVLFSISNVLLGKAQFEFIALLDYRFLSVDFFQIVLSDPHEAYGLVSLKIRYIHLSF